MPELTKKAVYDVLKTVKGPDQKTDLVRGNFVRGVSVRDGLVKVEIAVPSQDENYLAFTRSHARNVVMSVPGVKEANIVLESDAQTVPRKTIAGDAAGDAAGVSAVEHIISIGSGKGGVGKSTLAVNLAIALAQRGRRVGLMDTDVYGPSIPMMLGTKTPPAAVGQTLIPPQAFGIRFMSLGLLVEDDKPVIWRGPMLHGLVQQFINQVDWGKLDFLLVDLPPGTGDVHLSLVQNCKLSGAVVVSTPQPVSLLDAGKALRMFQETGCRILGMIENMSYYICPSCGTKEYLFGQGGVQRYAREIGVPFLGEIPLLKQIREGGDSGQPAITQEANKADGADVTAIEAFNHVLDNLVTQIETSSEGPQRGTLEITD